MARSIELAALGPQEDYVDGHEEPDPQHRPPAALAAPDGFGQALLHGRQIDTRGLEGLLNEFLVQRVSDWIDRAASSMGRARPSFGSMYLRLSRSAATRTS